MDAPQFSFGGNIRTYRLAITTTGEWSRNAAGYIAGMPVQTIRDNALAVVVTVVNRLNGIFTRELASSFQLVNPPTDNNATNIIFDDPATDPFANNDQELEVTHAAIVARVGLTNFDIKHECARQNDGIRIWRI